jgi:hypothetical protein
VADKPGGYRGEDEQLEVEGEEIRASHVERVHGQAPSMFAGFSPLGNSGPVRRPLLNPGMGVLCEV